MAGSPAQRNYRAPMAQGWGVLGFSPETAKASLPGQGSIGDQDIRKPVGSNQINQVRPTNFQGLQLRHYLPLLSQRFNIAHSASILAEQKTPMVQLQTNKPQGGMGIGKLKNLNVNAQPRYNNLLAKATAFGRFSSQVQPG